MSPENTYTELIKKLLEIYCFFHAWEENNKAENIWQILPVHKHYFAANWNDLPGISNMLG